MAGKKSNAINKNLLVWGVITAAAVAGIIITVMDYREWRRLETQRYGQGWSDLQSVALPLTWKYADSKLGVEMWLPREWEGTAVSKYFTLRAGREYEADKKVWEEELPGGRVIIHQRLAKTVGTKRVMLETQMGEEEWGKWKETVQKIWESIKQG